MAEMDEVFKALADPSRRLLLDSLNARNGQSLGELCARLSMARQSVSKHLAVLEAANLITTVWRGRQKLHYLNAAPINAIADRWINSIRPCAGADTRGSENSIGDRTHERQPRLCLHHLYPHHARATLAGDHRPGLLAPLHGPRDGVGLGERLHLYMGGRRG